MSAFGFEYFCGANVLIRVGDMPILEATGLSLSIQESKRPIYGYSSRMFDAVAAGQVIVQGQLLINYVHQDYLYHAINAGLGITAPKGDEGPPPKLGQSDIEDYMSSLGSNPELEGGMIDALRQQFWADQFIDNSVSRLEKSRNPHDNLSGVNLRVTFGDQDLGIQDSGKTGIHISNVYFLGRSTVISISEEVIVESYPFIARDLQSLKPRTTAMWRSSEATDPRNNPNVNISSR